MSRRERRGSTSASTYCWSGRSRPRPIWFERRRSTPSPGSCRPRRALDRSERPGSFRSSYSQPVGCSPHRFRTKRQFWSYCGLGIVTRSSSDWIQTADGGWVKARVPQTRGLSRQHNRFLKDIFKGAATTVITQRTKDPIYARYQRLLDGGTKPALAKLSLARMIAATVLRMWKDEEAYDPGRAGLSTETREG